MFENTETCHWLGGRIKSKPLAPKLFSSVIALSVLMSNLSDQKFDIYDCRLTAGILWYIKGRFLNNITLITQDFLPFVLVWFDHVSCDPYVTVFSAVLGHFPK